MKKTSISVIVIVILYICISYVYSLHVFDSNSGQFNPDSYKNSWDKKDDYTKDINSKLINSLYNIKENVKNIREEEYEDISNNFSIYSMTYDGLNTSYYFVDASKIDEFIEKNNLKNPKNLKFEQTAKLPFENDDYKNILADFSKEKKDAKIIGKDEKGNAIYDISPDTVVLSVYNGDIKAYAYIDNRLLDTRAVLDNKTPKTANYRIVMIAPQKNDSYNLYALEYNKDYLKNNYTADTENKINIDEDNPKENK